jgi:hypothetical protein
MPDEKDEQEGMKVVDRRRFTSEGERRNGTEDEVEAPRVPTPEPEVKPPTPAEPASPDPLGASEQEYREAGPPAARTVFESLLMSLSTTAMLQMGLVEDPEQGRFPADLEAARHTIDLLGVLEEKTRGNLTPEEKQLLEQLLSELRLLFVRVSGGELPQSSPPGQ